MSDFGGSQHVGRIIGHQAEPVARTYTIFRRMTRHVVLFFVLLFCWVMFGEEGNRGYGADFGHCKRCPVQRVILVQAPASSVYWLCEAKDRIG